MKKILLLITALIFIGCGSIKKNKQNTSIDFKSELNASNFDYKRFRDSSYILKPFDASKPMLIGKDTLVNVIIENHYKDRWHIQKDTIHKIDTQVVEIESKQKETDNSKVYLYLFGFGFFFLALIIIFIVWYFSRKLK